MEVAKYVNFEAKRAVSSYDFGMYGMSLHDYVWKHFGPASTKEDQKWWIRSVGCVGAPDDIINGEALHLMTDSVDKITRLLEAC